MAAEREWQLERVASNFVGTIFLTLDLIRLLVYEVQLFTRRIEVWLVVIVC